MNWLKRVFNAPLLLKLHWDHCLLRVKVDHAQRVLYNTIDQFGYKDTSHLVRELEAKLERLSDLEERMKKLW